MRFKNFLGSILALVAIAGAPSTSIGADFRFPQSFDTSSWKNHVRVATTANITLSGTQTVDAVVLVPGNRVLAKNQTSGLQNGVWIVSSGAWVRTADADNGAKLGTNAVVLVDEGTTNGGTAWRLSTTGTIIVGTTSQTWAAFGAGGGGGGGSPGSPSTSIQFNSAGVFAGSANLEWTGSALNLIGGFSGNGFVEHPSLITPSALAVDTDSYTPAGLNNAFALRISSSAAINLLGIAAQPAGTLLLVENVGSFTIVLQPLSSTTPANSFVISSGVIPALNPGEAVWMWYDSAAQTSVGGWQVVYFNTPGSSYATVRSGLTSANLTQRGRINCGNGLQCTDVGASSFWTNFAVRANDASITVVSNGVSVGVLQSDAQHGNLGGGSDHAVVVAAGANGFMSGTDKTKLDGIGTGANVTSVAGRTGVVTLAAADVSGVEVTANRNAASGYAGLSAGSLITGSQIPYATPTVNTLSDASTFSQGVANTCMRSDARLLVTTAVPSVNVLTDASTFSQGTSTSLIRADARFIATTAAPSTNITSDVNATTLGAATSFVRSDARFVATTAAPTVNVLTDASSFSQGTSASLLRADARFIATTAAPSVTVKSENTAASQGTSTSFVRSDAQFQVATAAPGTNVTSDANASTQGSSNNVLRADARLVATTAAPTVNVLTDASTFTQGVAASLLRSDARFIATTAAPSVNTLSDASTNSQGTSTSFSRADHRHIATTAAPSSASIHSDHDTATQGTSTSLIRSDAIFTALTAAPATLDGTASNSQGTSNSLSRADHTHGFPASVSIDVTFSGAGTGLAVTNNQTIGGTLIVTGVATLNGGAVWGQIAVPAVPTGTNLKFSNVAIANQALPYFQNANFSFAGGVCPPGAMNYWGSYPQVSGAGITAGSDFANSIFGQQQRCVANGGGCTFPARTGSTLQTRAAHAHLLSAASTARTYGDMYSSAAGLGDPVAFLNDGFVFLSTWSDTTNQAQQNVFVGLGVLWNNGVDSAATREGVSFNYNTNVSSQTGNYQFTTVVGNPLPTGFTQTDLGASFPRSVTNIYQGLIFAPPATTGIGYQICDVTTPGIGSVSTCVRGVQSTNLPAGTSGLVKENYCQHNPTAIDGGTGLDGAATTATACAHEVYLEIGCGGWFGVQ